jgi:hypothetical protein
MSALITAERALAPRKAASICIFDGAPVKVYAFLGEDAARLD